MNPVLFHRAMRTGLIATALAGAAFAQPVLAHEAGGQPRESTVVVSGEGNSAIAPDMAIITLSVVKDAKTAREALDANNADMAAVLKALKEGGIEARDLQTSGFTINPQYSYPTGNDGQNRPPELVGYQVVNGLSIRVRDLSKLGEIIDQSVTLGVNQGGSIQFTNDKPEAAITEARKAAVADAKAKAETLTEAAGVKLGRVIEISEVVGRPQPVMMARSSMKEFAGDAVPVQGGENSYDVTVTVTFGIEQ